MLTAQAVAARVGALVGQVVLAWYLGPEEFGLMALALTVQVFIGVLQQAGLKEVLVQRHRHFSRLAPTTFWLSVMIGFLAATVMVCVAPWVARAYGAGHSASGNAIDRSVLVPMLWVLAVAMPLSSSGTVAVARLQMQMRFDVLTLLALIQSLGTVGLSCVFAALGCGVMSFVYPWPIIAAINTSIAWYRSAPGISLRPSLKRWKYILRDSTKLLLASAFIQCTTQGGAIVLGVLHSDNATVGIFAFAFSFALQTTQLLTHNLGNVVFPVLARLSEQPERQREAFFKAARLLAVVGAPICLLQAALAPALLETFFHGKWAPAALPMQILSVAMAWQLANGPALQFLIALKKNSLVLSLAIVFAAIFLSLVVVGGLIGGATAVAVAVAAYNVIVGQICLQAPARVAGYGQWKAAGTYVVPFLLSSGATAAAAFIWHLQQLSRSSIVELIAVSVLSVTLYIILLRLLSPSSFAQLKDILTGLLRRRVSTA